MAEGNYEVVFNGMMVRGVEPDQVKQNLAKLFKVDISKIEPLFSGNMVVVKSGIDQEAAGRYQAAMKKAGAVCAIREKQNENVKPKADPAPQVSQPQAPSEKSATETVIENRQTEVSSSSDDDMLAPPGVQIIEPVVVPEPEIDISAMNMAEVGADVTDPVAPPPPLEVNIDNLDMAEVGADVTDPVAPPPPLDVNIDSMSMADAGDDVTDPVPPIPEPDIDISKLKFADEG